MYVVYTNNIILDTTSWGRDVPSSGPACLAKPARPAKPAKPATSTSSCVHFMLNYYFFGWGGE